ncbi:hypothetical protein GCM10027428_31140 [Haliea atlantica]
MVVFQTEDLGPAQLAVDFTHPQAVPRAGPVNLAQVLELSTRDAQLARVIAGAGLEQQDVHRARV